MAKRILAAATLLLLPLAAFGQGLKYDLAQCYEKDEIRSVLIRREVKADIVMECQGSQSKFPMNVATLTEYVEKTIDVDERGLPVKTITRYDRAEIRTDEASGTLTRDMPYSGNIYMVEKTEDGAKVRKMRGEEVTGEMKKELAVSVEGSFHKLLPGSGVEPGTSWKIPLEAVRELFSINQEIEGETSATFVDIEQKDDIETAFIKVEGKIKFSEGSIVFNYSVGGRMRFDLSAKKITNIDWLALIEVSGSKEAQGVTMNYSGEGTANVVYTSGAGGEKAGLVPEETDEPVEEPEKKPGEKVEPPEESAEEPPVEKKEETSEEPVKQPGDGKEKPELPETPKKVPETPKDDK